MGIDGIENIKHIIEKIKKMFEGEYINGKINGKVKEYYEKSKLKFEG